MKILFIVFLVCITFLFTFILFPIRIGSPIISTQLEFWSHRNNSIERAQKMSKIFKGIELDVVYDTTLRNLDVRHDENQKPSNLNLFTLLDSTKNNNSKYWIDLKNLNSTNIEMILDLLNVYFKSNFEIKKRIIIESPNATVLNKFSKEGFYTSYWVPNYPNTKSVFSYLKFFLRTKYHLIVYKYNAISAPAEMLPIMSFFYPKHHFHVWTNEGGDLKFLPNIQKLCKNNSVRVILVDYNSNYLLKNR